MSSIIANIADFSFASSFVHAQIVLVNLQDLDQRGLGHLRIIEEVEKGIGVVIVAARERPGGSSNNAVTAVRKPLLEILECLVVDLARQDVDKDHLVAFIAHRKRIDDFRNNFRADVFQALNGLLSGRRIGVGFTHQLPDQLIRAKAAKNSHQKNRKSGCNSNQKKDTRIQVV